MEKVFFESEGAKCAGFLGIPEGDAGKRHPAIVLGHGFGIRKESLIDEAEYLTRAGFVTLAFEYRSLGESEGEPRGSIVPLNQVEDFRNAISFVQRRAEVDPERVGIWGASFGGGVVIRTASVDRRVKCVVAMAPIVNGRRWLDGVWGGSRFHKLREIIEADREKRYDGEPGGHLVIGAEDLPAVLPIDERGGRQNARSMAERGRPLLEGTGQISIASIEKVIEWEPDRYIELVSPTPLLVVTPGQWDIMHRFDHIKEMWQRAGEPKKLIPLACEQMEVYLPPWQTRALEHAEAWFKEWL